MFEPKYTITNKILTNLNRISAAHNLIVNASLIPRWEAKLRKEALVRSVHFSTHIEGNLLTLPQVRGVLEGEDLYVRPRDKQEVINYEHVLTYIDSVKGGDITEGTLKEINRLTLEDLEGNGHYREVQNYVVKVEKGKEKVVYTPPAPEEVPGLMEDFVDWIAHSFESGDSPILIAGIAHFEFVDIHPFLDGNGRSARALAAMILYKGGYETKKLFSLEEYYDNRLEAYYSAIQSVRESDGDMTEWLEYFTEGIAAELTRVEEEVKQISRDRLMKERLGQLALNKRQMRAVAYLQKHGKITNKECREHCKSTRITAARDLAELVEYKLLKKVGNGRGLHYVLV